MYTELQLVRVGQRNMR